MSYSDVINARETDSDTGRLGMLTANTTIAGSDSQSLLGNEIWTVVAATPYTQESTSYPQTYVTFASAGLTITPNTVDTQEQNLKALLNSDAKDLLDAPTDVVGNAYQWKQKNTNGVVNMNTYTLSNIVKTDLFPQDKV